MALSGSSSVVATDPGDDVCRGVVGAFDEGGDGGGWELRFALDTARSHNFLLVCHFWHDCL